jgi:GPH family glycoside/pentoside/hexuronide:cation symporter
VAAIRERQAPERQHRERLLADVRPLLKNRPFLILIASYMVSAFGSNLPATLLLYYVEYVLQSGLAELFLVEYLLTGVLFLPLWIALSARVGKKRAWIASMAVNTGAFIGVYFLGPGDVLAYGVLVFLSGVGMGATLAIPSSMQADVIDYDALISGQRREGRYIGLWSIARKLVAALGVGLGLSALGWVGYVPNSAQSPQVLQALRVLYALVPSLCNLIAIGIALYYPIDKQIQTAILGAIEARGRGEAVDDPLRPGHRVLTPA